MRYPGGVEALRGVDLDIDAGDFAVVVGASGSGKTTLLKCLNGSVRPARGTVTVNGTSMALARGRELREARRRIALIPQHLDLIGGSSVLANTLIGRLGAVPPLGGLLGVFSKEDRRAALHSLERVGLAGKEGRRVDTLSGGEQQRVAICRSLAQVPAVMVADEPVASLDSLLAARIMDILRGINRQDGITVVVALHDLELAELYATRIIALDRGTVVHSGPRKEMTSRDLRRLLQEVSSP